MKTILISTYKEFPIGLRTIASYLENEGHEVFLQRLYRAKKSAIIQLLDTINPDLIGFTCYTPNFLTILQIAHFVKQYLPKIKIVLGNIHATVFYESILEKFPYIDYIVLGEGEVPMKELAEHMIGKRDFDEVHNIAYRASGGNIIRTKRQTAFPHLDEFSCIPRHPMPRDIVVSHYHMVSYQIKKGKISFKREAALSSSRGCIYNCVYCAEDNITQGRLSWESPQKTVDTIEFICINYNIFCFSFADPLFTFNKERVKNICYEIIRRNLKIHWTFQTHPNHIDNGLLFLIKRAGCDGFNIGVDCFTEGALARYRKIKIDFDRLARTIKIAKSIKLSVKCNFIVGWPDENFNSVLSPVRLIYKLRPEYISIFPLYLLPGTKLYNQAVSNGIIDKNYWLNREKPKFYPGIYCKKGNNIRGLFKLRLQQLLLNGASLIICRSMSGIFFTLSYQLENWITSLEDNFCKMFRKWK